MDRRRFLVVLPLLPVALKALREPETPLDRTTVVRTTLIERQRDFLRWAESRGAHFTPYQRHIVDGFHPSPTAL